MNTVSVFVYAADVIGRVGVLLILSGLFLLAISAIWIIATAIHNDSVYDKSQKIQYPNKRVFMFTGSAFLMFFISVLIPSERAMYMIAASEAGEMIVKSPDAQEIFDDLKQVIRGKLKQSLAPDDPK